MTKAAHYSDVDAYHEAKQPGSFMIGEVSEKGTQRLWYWCPCGCGRPGSLLIGNRFKPSSSPSWEWNGYTDAATLSPSVHDVGHWHGWLTDGEWRSC